MKVGGLMICVFFICCLFGHITEAKSYSKFDDLEIEKRLKTINKPAVKIIKTIDGERYGCVDFFKQPAFDHPSMKNHTYHYNMRPTRKGTRETKTNSTGFGHLWENGVGCPIGTVPIRRVTKDDLLRLDSLGDDHRPRPSWNITSPVDPSQHYHAVVRTSYNYREPRYGGARMDLCITAPKVKPNQFSSARLHIQIGKSDLLFVGITVHPVLYKDTRPRIFVYTSSGGRSCYNSNCDLGIVMVRPDIPLGMVLSPVSVRKDRTTHYARFGIIRDPANGNWWFEFGQKEAEAEAGFWPASRFQESYGNFIEWGGEVYTASQPSPEMGFGVFPKKTWDPIDMMIYDAYMKRIQVLDKDYNVDPRVDHLETFVDDTRGYNVIDSPMWLSDYPNPGHIAFYGGPGGI